MTDRARSQYPFAAIVGQEPMKLALLLAAVDWRLGVLLRGDKGAGKTTAARALAALLPAPAPFINLPVGATEDRLLGGLHLERALKGEPALKPGLLAEAHGGVLYADEVNLLPGHLGDALLDAAASGVHAVEREGFSASHPAEFILLGSMNPEEGTLRAQLLDRFALAVDVAAPSMPAERHAIVQRRLAYERDRSAFHATWQPEHQALAERILAARASLAAMRYAGERLAEISDQVAAHGVRSLRADLAALRAALAYAALCGEMDVTADHVNTVLPLVLAHRQPQRSRQPPAAPPRPPSSEPPPPSSSEPDEKQQGASGFERIFGASSLHLRPLENTAFAEPVRGSAASSASLAPGPIVGTRKTQSPGELDVRASLGHALREQGTAALTAGNLHERVRAPRSGTRFLLLIDSSGSHAAQQRMRLVKGAALGLLSASFKREDEVAIIAFRGGAAEVLLEPSRELNDAVTALDYLPTGGRTPLAHALVSARALVTPQTHLILFTDGRPNVALNGGDPIDDAVGAAAELSCQALLVDTAAPTSGSLSINPRLAEALSARCVTLNELVADDECLMR